MKPTSSWTFKKSALAAATCTLADKKAQRNDKTNLRGVVNHRRQLDLGHRIHDDLDKYLETSLGVENYRDRQVVAHGLEAVHVGGVGQLVDSIASVRCLRGWSAGQFTSL